MAPSTRSKTAAMKRLKKRPTITGSIYRRDVLSFLKRGQLEELRGVSRRFNADIVAWSAARKPRRSLYELTIGTDPVRIKKDGSLHASAAEKWQDWREASAGAGCCRQLEMASRGLVGELLYTNGDEARIIAVTVAFNDEVPSEGRYMLATPNRLDEESAFELVHLLHHVDGAAFTVISVAIAQELHHEDHLNPLVLAALNEVSPTGSFRVFAQEADTAILPDETAPGGIDFDGLADYDMIAKCASFIITNHFEDLPGVLAFLVSGRVSQRVVIELISATSERLNWTIKYLRDEITGLARRIPAFGIIYNAHKKLPEVCRSLVGERRMGRDGEEVAFAFRNETEGRDFRVVFMKDKDGYHNRMEIEFARL